MTAMGVPMLWMGEEFGEHKRKSQTVTQPKKIAWPLLARDLNRDLFEFYKQLIALRKQSKALQNDSIEFFHENPDNRVLAYVRSSEGENVVVVVNFSDKHLAKYRLPNFPLTGTWHELMGSEIKVAEDSLVLELPASEAKVFVYQ